jgi:hypothetical protein
MRLWNDLKEMFYNILMLFISILLILLMFGAIGWILLKLSGQI